MGLADRDPFHAVLGHCDSAYPPDADGMMQWLLSGPRGGLTADLLADIMEAIEAGAIGCHKVRLIDGRISPFATIIKVEDAKVVAKRRLIAPVLMSMGTLRLSDNAKIDPGPPSLATESPLPEAQSEITLAPLTGDKIRPGDNAYRKRGARSHRTELLSAYDGLPAEDRRTVKRAHGAICKNNCWKIAPRGYSLTSLRRVLTARFKGSEVVP